MTLGSELQETPRRNPWTRRWQACSVLAVANMARGILWPLRGWDVLAAVVLLTALVGCCAMHIRTGRAIRVAQEDARLKAREADAALRTPRVPDAGPDQCPICGGYGLDALAKDDADMERGALAKVVPWGSRRAHWDCAEWSPYVEPPSRFQCRWCGHCETAADADELQRLRVAHADCVQYWGGDRSRDRARPAVTTTDRPDPVGAYSRCECCENHYFAPSAEAAEVLLIEHAKTCAKRPRPSEPKRLVSKRRDGTRPATAAEYAYWLCGFIQRGGTPSHEYDYSFARWDFEFATFDFMTHGECGARSRHIIMPDGVRWLGGDIGHSTIYMMDGFLPHGTFVPVFSDPEFDFAQGVAAVRPGKLRASVRSSEFDAFMRVADAKIAEINADLTGICDRT